eukprot:COSAG02_NODE_4125_length_5743_cov_5.905741_7_plen_42_part_00
MLQRKDSELKRKDALLQQIETALQKQSVLDKGVQDFYNWHS